MYLQNNTIFSQPSWSLLSNPFIKMESRADIKKRKKKVFIEFSFRFSTLELINSIARLFCFQLCYYNSILNHLPKHQKSSGKQQQPPKIQRLQIFTLLFLADLESLFSFTVKKSWKKKYAECWDFPLWNSEVWIGNSKYDSNTGKSYLFTFMDLISTEKRSGTAGSKTKIIN